MIKVGSEITVMHFGAAVLARVTALDETDFLYDVIGDKTKGVCTVALNKESIEWSEGWSEDVAVALQASNALADEDPMVRFVVNTGRSSGPPNIQSIPRRNFHWNRMSSRKP